MGWTRRFPEAFVFNGTSSQNGIPMPDKMQPITWWMPPQGVGMPVVPLHLQEQTRHRTVVIHKTYPSFRLRLFENKKWHWRFIRGFSPHHYISGEKRYTRWCPLLTTLHQNKTVCCPWGRNIEQQLKFSQLSCHRIYSFLIWAAAPPPPQHTERLLNSFWLQCVNTNFRGFCKGGSYKTGAVFWRSYHLSFLTCFDVHWYKVRGPQRFSPKSKRDTFFQDIVKISQRRDIFFCNHRARFSAPRLPHHRVGDSWTVASPACYNGSARLTSPKIFSSFPSQFNLNLLSPRNGILLQNWNFLTVWEKAMRRQKVALSSSFLRQSNAQSNDASYCYCRGTTNNRHSHQALWNKCASST